MSLFQCHKCGCLENTACTDCSHCTYMLNSEFIEGKNERVMEPLKSYKDLLGIPYSEPFTALCSACCPVWYTKEGRYGVGPNPNPKPGEGAWHGKFKRIYLPKGKFSTASNGNLMHTETKDEEVQKWALEKEEGT